jgi:nitrite reductase/ring-hydroxylating ferredoxin subunit
MTTDADADGDRGPTRHYVVDEADIDEGERVLVEVEGREIGVFNVGGELYALANHCAHMGGPVCEGGLMGYFTSDDDGNLRYEREGEILACPWHGWEFDVETGEHVAGSKYRLPTYDVTVEDGAVYVFA